MPAPPASRIIPAHCFWGAPRGRQLGRIIAITNQKGGVGKTTTSVNLAASLAATKRRVLLIDLDPQGNATMGSGIDKRTLTASTYDVLVDERAIAEVAVAAGNSGFAIVPANDDLTGAEIALLELPQRAQRLKRALQAVADQYDYVLIDCPPSLNMLTLNALVVAEGILIPKQCEYYALEGLTALMRTVDKIRATLNPALQVEGVLRTMFDPRNNLATEVSSQLVAHFGERVSRTRGRSVAAHTGATILGGRRRTRSQWITHMATKKRGLGRGLDALLGNIEPAQAGGMESTAAPRDSELRHLPVDLIRRGKYQPRIDMHTESLDDLAASIRAQGVVQPVVVTPAGKGEYEIIAGERRWRAAQLAGLQEIPAVVRDVADQAAMAMALIENIQRENLNPME